MGRPVDRPCAAPRWVLEELEVSGYDEDEAAVIASMFVKDREGRPLEGPEARAALVMCQLDRMGERRRAGV